MGSNSDRSINYFLSAFFAFVSFHTSSLQVSNVLLLAEELALIGNIQNHISDVVGAKRDPERIVAYNN